MTPPPEPIAILGMGCRFPKAADPQAFWRLIRDGVDAITEIPRDRFDLDAYYDPRPATPGRIMTRWGGFLDGIELFDAGFFGMSPREAERLDPQQRLLLETTWEALETAGQVPAGLRGSDTAVFIGMWLNEYETRMFRDPARIDFHMTTGTGRYTASGRLSHVFGWHGPSVTIDCACSSSLVAVHLACRSLQAGESDLAIAGGANVLLEPSITLAYSQSRMMAPDGRCKFGDARANGYVRSDGAGVVVLKRLSRALADGDPIEAVILGSAVNNDGDSSGSLGTPARLGQEDLLRKACRAAGVLPADVDFVEAHGTGTRAGDPVEVHALAAVLGEGRPADRPLVIGSVKTNIGHTEGAAGMAGLIKATLALKHGLIPGNLHYDTPNPDIPWDRLPVEIPPQARRWPETGRPAIAGVSSFGIAGTNAHVILQRYEPVAPVPSAPASRVKMQLLPLSGHSPEALADLARSWQGFLAERPEARPDWLHDVCYTASVCRGHHDHRLAIVGCSPQEMAQRLTAFLAASPPEPGRASGCRGSEASSGLVFVFPGQGSQWLGMGRDLQEREPAFREALERCDGEIRDQVGWSVLEELAAPEARSRLGEIDVVQPLLFSIQVALAALWRAWGVEPDAVVGHSMGEVAAAHVAGALSLADAARVICRRSRLLRRVSGQGIMVVVGLPFDKAQKLIGPWADRISVAVSNGPTSTVLSGDPAALEQVLMGLRERDVFCRPVQVDVASHSPQMDALREELLHELAGLRPAAPMLPFYSTVSGQREHAAIFGARYWERNLREPVMFYATVKQLIADGNSTFLELSPHPILLAPIEGVLHEERRPGPALPSLHRDRSEQEMMLGSLGALYAAGRHIDWRRLHPWRGRCVPLPSYPWQRKRFWIEAKPFPASAAAPASVRAAETQPPQRYRIEWRAKRREACPRPGSPESWLILADRGGVARVLSARLEARGAACTLVEAGEQGTGSAEDWLEPLASRAASRRRGIVDLRGLDLPRLDEKSPADLEGILTRACVDVVRVLQALPRAGVPPRVWMATRGVHPVGSQSLPPALAASVLWGLARVMALEQPEAWGGIIDLDPATPGGEAHLLAGELLDPDEEDQVAFRDGQRFVPRLVQVKASAAAKVHWDSQGAYLITGGLGGVGLKVARWAVERGARHLVLLGRTGLPARSEWEGVSPDSTAGRRIAQIRAIESLGARVTVVAADVSDLEQMRRVFDHFGGEWPPLRGVIHTAGVLTTEPLAQLGPDSVQAVLHPKVGGAWVLHMLTRERSLDWLMLFSSGASVWGSMGYGHYAAANHFLDTLAHLRRLSGLPAVTINWGWWTGEGLAAAGEALFRQSGLAAMSPPDALVELEQVIASGAIQETVAAVDWSVFKPIYEAKRRRPLLDEITAGAVAPDREQASSGGRLVGLLQGLPAGERLERLRQHVAEEVAQILGFDSPDAVDPRRGFFKLGMDSMLTVQFRNRLEARLGQPLPSTVAFEYPTVEAMSDYLLHVVLAAKLGATAAAMVRPAAEITPAPAPADDLSEEELTALLAEKLRGKR